MADDSSESDSSEEGLDSGYDSPDVTDSHCDKQGDNPHNRHSLFNRTAKSIKTGGMARSLFAKAGHHFALK